MSDLCGYHWKRKLTVRVLSRLFGVEHDGIEHHCVREFGHNANPRRAMHRCVCGSVTYAVEDIQAMARETYRVRDERDH
jgi:hypothetical protein